MSIPKTLDNFKIVMVNGTTYDMASDFSVLVRSFRVSAPKPIRYTEKIDGRDGEIRKGKEYGPRTITARCSFFAVDPTDSFLLSDELIAVLFSREPFYVINDGLPGKRWLVEVADSFTPERMGTYGEFTLNFISDSPYSESTGTTMDDFTFDEEAWYFGEGLIAEDLIYTHSTSSFSIFNASACTIDPLELPLKISFEGASTNLIIKNVTTAEEWRYTGTTGVNESLTIDGVRSLKNEVVPVLGNTNRKLITLKPGWNDFTVSGPIGSFTISFDFRFYYL